MNRVRKPVKGWLRVLLIIIPFIVFAGVSQFLAMRVLGHKPSSGLFSPTTFQLAILELFMLAATFAVVAIFRRWVDKESFLSLGFGLNNFKRDSAVGFLMGVSMISAGFIVLLLLNEISWAGTDPDTLNLISSVILFLAVAFLEELLFRGYILNNLMLSMNRFVALLVSSVVFSLVHMGNANFNALSFLSILLAGLLLGLPYIYTKSLWLPIALHFSWNFFQGSIYGFNVSGIAEYSLITQSRSADTLLNGGEFGFEGSILAVLFLSFALAGLYFFYKRNEKMAAEAALLEIPVLPE